MFRLTIKNYSNFQVVVSVFGDQPTNGDEAVHKGYGIHVPFETLTVDNLLEAINKVLDDQTYAAIAKTRGQLLLDQVKGRLSVVRS